MIDRLGRLDLTLAGITRILADVLEPQFLNSSPLSTSNDSPSAQGAGGEQPQEETLKEKVGEEEEAEEEDQLFNEFQCEKE